MITYTGVQMSPGCGNVPTPLDIAVGMCRITRYAGALWVPLAAHSVIVAEFAYHNMDKHGDKAFAYGLLHDAHETVTGEMTRHYKPKELKPLENELDDLIFKAFNLDVELYRSSALFYKEMDQKALAAESLLLGLKGWPEYFERMEKRKPPVLDPYEEGVANVILRDYWRTPGMVLDGAIEQKRLTVALISIQIGDYEAARRSCIPGGWL